LIIPKIVTTDRNELDRSNLSSIKTSIEAFQKAVSHSQLQRQNQLRSPITSTKPKNDVGSYNLDTEIEGDIMTTEYLAIYEQPLDPAINEQITQYCSHKPCMPASDTMLKDIEITCGAIYKKDVKLFWFRDPNTATMLKLFESVPIYIGQFDTMKLSKFHAFYRSIERQERLMNSALYLKAELGNHRTDLGHLCKCSFDIFRPNIEDEMVNILNKTNKIIHRDIRSFLTEHSARL